MVLRLGVSLFVVIALSTSYNSSQPFSASSAEIELPFVQPDVSTKSSPLAVSLVRHLRAIGAKIYGAFWCSHCLEQKEVFALVTFRYSGICLLLLHNHNVSGLKLENCPPFEYAFFKRSQHRKLGSSTPEIFSRLLVFPHSLAKMFGREAAEMLDYVE